MVALMKYACGLQFTEYVFEDMETANKWLEDNGLADPYVYKLIPVAFYTKDGEVK